MSTPTTTVDTRYKANIIYYLYLKFQASINLETNLHQRSQLIKICTLDKKYVIIINIKFENLNSQLEYSMSSEKERREHPEETELRRVNILLRLIKDNVTYEDRNGLEALRLEPIDLKRKLHIDHDFEIVSLLELAMKTIDNKLAGIRAGKARSEQARKARENEI